MSNYRAEPNQAVSQSVASQKAFNSTQRQPLQGPQQTKRFFNRSAFANLSLYEQEQFEAFGQGPKVTPRFSLIHQAFEYQATCQPNALAAEHLDERISYAELERQAVQLACALSAKGVKKGDYVALFVRRSIPMLVGMLAILKLGAAYVPQDVSITPAATLKHILAITQTKVVLTLSTLAERVPQEGHDLIEIDAFMKTETSTQAASLEPIRMQPEQACLVLFTSGTTGTPNGVKVTHANLCNILLTGPGGLGMGPGTRVGQILNIAFDMAAWETLGALTQGASLVIRGPDISATAQCVDILIATPSILTTLDVEACANLSVVAVAGEPCPQPLADIWSQICTFYNACGPTETTIINTMQRYSPAMKNLTIGKPTPNNTVYILDKDREPVAIGEVGEMWAGGRAVTKGYLANRHLTAERYAPDPFLGGENRMFNTRDLGRWTQDGELEHRGRSDDQVKVRGFRVELDSVSAVLEAQPHSKRAIALKLDDRNLVAFMSPRSVDKDKALAALADILPYYCSPAFILTLDDLPLTSRGKIDKASLLSLAVSYAQHHPEVLA